MIEQQKFTGVATISKLYGSDGEVIINLFDCFPDEVDLEEPLFVYCDKLVVPLFFDSFKARSATKAQVSFADLDTNLRISEFIGQTLYAPKSYLAQTDDEEEDDEFYFEDLVGYEIYDLNSGRKGKILNHLDLKNNPLFVVDFDGCEVMVPACDEIIQDIYIDALVVEAEIPEGLYEFYNNKN